jgi:replicative DNA helicase
MTAPQIHVPPHDMNAELSLIGSLLFDPARFDEVADLVSAEAFHNPTAGRAFAAISELIAASKPVDPVTVFTRLEKSGRAQPGDDDWLVEALNTVPHAAHAKFYAETIAERFGRRKLLYALNDATGATRDLSADLDEILASVGGQLDRLVEGRTGGAASVDMTDLLLDVLRGIQSEKAPGLSTGFSGLDRLGATLKGLNILAARPSVGKTAFAAALALAVARQGVQVLFVSLEQTRTELATRLLSIEARVGNLFAGRKLSALENNTILEASGRLNELPIIVDDTSPRTVSQIAAVARIAKRRRGLGLILIDYLQLLAPEDRRLPREQQVAEMTKGLRNMGRALGVPVVALAQINRAVEARTDKRPLLSDLRESGAIEQDADQVWFLTRAAYQNESADPTEASVVVAKHRNGRTGEVPLRWNAASMTFTDEDQWAPTGTAFDLTADDAA